MPVLAEIEYDESKYNSVVETNPPRPLVVGDRMNVPGRPTTPELSRGHRNGTIVSFTNYHTVAIDDPKVTLPYYVRTQHTSIRNSNRTKRDRTENEQLNESKSGAIKTQLSEAIKWVRAKLKLINSLLKTIDNFFKMLALVVMKINQLIAFIKALPVTIVLLMAKILAKLISAGKSAASASLSKVGGSGSNKSSGSEFGGLLKETKRTLTSAASVASSALLLGTSVAVLASTFSGSAPSSKKKAKKIL
jgi:hypothetical protein